MEQDGYYFRLRGLISGPFALDELKKLAARGALSRIHEISRDQVAWSNAGKFESLFPDAPVLEASRGLPGAPTAARLPPPLPQLPASITGSTSKPSVVSQPAAAPTNTISSTIERPTTPPESRRFYYRQRGITVGPMQWGRLKELAIAGKLDPSADTWSAVGEKPIPAAEVAGLIFASRATVAKRAVRLTPKQLWIFAGVSGFALLVASAAITYLIRTIYSETTSSVQPPDARGGKAMNHSVRP